MKYISFRYVNRDTWGIYGPDGGIIDLGAEFITTLPTLRDYLAGDPPDGWEPQYRPTRASARRYRSVVHTSLNNGPVRWA